ncbi:MAG: OmpA family protein [Alphaproteobacteria bacterium]
MQLQKTLAIAISALLLTSCANLDILKKKPIHGNNFNAELARDYLKFADAEAKRYDWIDSDHFARKGRLAQKNKEVGPEDLAKWDLTPAHRAELSNAKSQLLASLTAANKIKFPKEAADAQAYFDCWVEEQEENWQQDAIVYCKDHFRDALSRLHNVIARAEPAPVTQAQVEEKPEYKFTVHFDFDKSDIVSSEEEILKKTVEAFNRLGSKKIHLSGHADDTGSDSYNDKLSLKRANRVKDYLTNSGLDKNVFEVHYYGKHKLAVPTPHGIKERLNRRVEIDLD